jgi:hypothetical protein
LVDSINRNSPHYNTIKALTNLNDNLFNNNALKEALNTQSNLFNNSALKEFINIQKNLLDVSGIKEALSTQKSLFNNNAHKEALNTLNNLFNNSALKEFINIQKHLPRSNLAKEFANINHNLPDVNVLESFSKSIAPDSVISDILQSTELNKENIEQFESALEFISSTSDLTPDQIESLPSATKFSLFRIYTQLLPWILFLLSGYSATESEKTLLRKINENQEIVQEQIVNAKNEMLQAERKNYSAILLIRHNNSVEKLSVDKNLKSILKRLDEQQRFALKHCRFIKGKDVVVREGPVKNSNQLNCYLIMSL